MLTSSSDVDKRNALRSEAQARLKSGDTFRPSPSLAISPDTLNVLHKLSETSDGAEHTLKLLHELQVHQVELDMQQAQIQDTERMLNEDLARYLYCFESAPVAYFVVDADGYIKESNRAGASLFGCMASEMEGSLVISSITLGSRAKVIEALQRLKDGSERELCRAQFIGRIGSSFPIQIAATSSPCKRYFLLTMVELTD